MIVSDQRTTPFTNLQLLGTTLPASGIFFCAIIIFFAYFIRGIAGFGSALIAVPLLALQLDLPLIVPVICLLDYLASVTHGLQNRALIRWPDLLPLLPFSLAGLLTGFYILRHVDATSLATALAVFIVIYAVYALLPLPPLRGRRLWAAPAGFFGGMIGVIFGTGGPFYVIYMGLRQLDKTEFRATIATVFMIDGGMRLISFFAGGFYGHGAFLAVFAALPLLVAGLWTGGRIHVAISQRNFVRLVSLILLGSGAVLFFKVS